MSANNWAVCPRCRFRHEKRAGELRAAADAAYGTVSVEDWKVMDQAAINARGPFTETQFREDYEIAGAEEGCVEVRYSGECSECRLSLSFNHAEPIEGIEVPA